MLIVPLILAGVFSFIGLFGQFASTLLSLSLAVAIDGITPTFTIAAQSLATGVNRARLDVGLLIAGISPDTVVIGDSVFTPTSANEFAARHPRGSPLAEQSWDDFLSVTPQDTLGRDSEGATPCATTPTHPSGLAKVSHKTEPLVSALFSENSRQAISDWIESAQVPTGCSPFMKFIATCLRTRSWTLNLLTIGKLELTVYQLLVSFLLCLATLVLGLLFWQPINWIISTLRTPVYDPTERLCYRDGCKYYTVQETPEGPWMKIYDLPDLCRFRDILAASGHDLPSWMSDIGIPITSNPNNSENVTEDEELTSPGSDGLATDDEVSASIPDDHRTEHDEGPTSVSDLPIRNNEDSPIPSHEEDVDSEDCASDISDDEGDYEDGNNVMPTQDDRELSGLDVDALLCERYGSYHRPKKTSYIEEGGVVPYDSLRTQERQDLILRILTKRRRSGFDNALLRGEWNRRRLIALGRVTEKESEIRSPASANHESPPHVVLLNPSPTTTPSSGRFVAQAITPVAFSSTSSNIIPRLHSHAVVQKSESRHSRPAQTHPNTQQPALNQPEQMKPYFVSGVVARIVKEQERRKFDAETKVILQKLCRGTTQPRGLNASIHAH